jgi:hypothetical protein
VESVGDVLLLSREDVASRKRSRKVGTREWCKLMNVVKKAVLGLIEGPTCCRTKEKAAI